MKKSFSVFTLVMLLAVQILTPVTYAVGDEEFVEESIVQEETPEDVEEVSDDVDGETDGVDLDEEEDEDSLSEEDDSFSGDAVDEDSLEMSGDIIPDAENEGGDVVVIDSESGAVAATVSEVVVESGVDVSGTSSAAGSSESSVTVDDEFITKLSKQGSVAKIAEELGINWYTDSSEWAIKAGIEGKYLGTKEQNNVIREYFIQHAREILGAQESNEVVNEEVVEEPEVVVELNKEEISGKKYYNGVTVNVLAPAKSFPEGTTLSITPIKKKNELNEIKEQLVDSQEQVTEESTVVAFDISFLYSGEEVQPVSGQTVQVTFNYENHEGLTDANENEDKELKVYHLNDKDGSGNKVEDISEVKVETVETVKNEEGEIVVEAENFSIYTIVTQVAEEGPEAIENQLANFVYGEISIARPDGLSGEYPDIEGFTVMDRNLGATTNDITSTGSYGYHYQWGNNYGISLGLSSGEVLVPGGIPWKSYYDNSGFYFSGFVGGEGYGGDVWQDGHHEGVWGGAYDSPTNNWGLSGANFTGRQGPCPEGWHVPSAGEWGLLVKYWAVASNVNYEKDNNYTYYNGSSYDASLFNLNGGVSDFLSDFNLPYAGYRSNGLAVLSDVGSNGHYWSSSPYVDNSRNDSSFELYFSLTNVNSNYVFVRGNGRSVRCFKDTYLGTGEIHTITFNFNGGSGSTASINVLSGEKAIEPSEPVKEGYDFAGWYKEDTYENEFNFDDEVITGDIELYAKWFNPEEVGQGFEVGCFTYKTLGLSGSDGYIVEVAGYLESKPGCSLVDVTIPGKVELAGREYTVYSVGDNAFYGKGFSGLLTLGEGIREIKRFGFASNSITGLILPNSLLSIGERVFASNSQLKTISFGNSLQRIGNNSFKDCGLVELKFPDSLRTIGETNESNGVFENNTNLETVVFNEGLQYIRANAFKNTGIKSIVLPSTVLEIGYHSFSSGANLTEVQLNEGLQRIGESAFVGDILLTGITIPSTVTYLGNNLFCDTSGCSPIEKLVFNAKNVSYKDAAYTFSSLTSLKTVIWNGSGVIPNRIFDGKPIENLIIGEDVTGIGDDAFRGTQITGLTIPGNVLTIGDNAFYQVPLETLNLEEGIVTIGQNAFMSNHLSELIIPDTVTFIGNNAFSRKPSVNGGKINRCVVGNGITNINNCNLGYCEDIEIGNGVTSLGPWNFCGGETILKKIKIGDSVTDINIGTFTSMKNIEEIEIGNGLTEIKNLFGGTPNLTGLKLGNSITTIGTGEFSGAQFSKVDLPTSLTTLGKGAFCSDAAKAPGSIIGVVSGATTEQITSLEAQDKTACFVLKKDKYTLTYNAGVHSGKVDNQSTLGVVVDYNGIVQLTGNGVKTATSDKGYAFLGWTDEEGKKTTINSILLDEDKVVYPVFKDTISATFKGNINLLNGGEEEITLPCDRYNNEETCEVTVPSIRENLNTPTVRGYSVASGTGSAILSLSGIQLTQENISGNNLKVSISSNVIGYAQTFAPAITYDVVYKKGEGVTSITNITANSCTIAATYNGVEQLQYCTVTAPTIETNNSLPGNWGYYNNGTSIKAGDPIQIYGDQTLVAFSEGVNYTISYNMDGGAWKQGAVFTGTYQEGEYFDLPTSSAVVKTGYTFKGWIDATTQQPVTQITSSDQTSKVFNATWRKDNYRIIYDNIGYDVSIPTTYGYDNSVSIPNLENGRYGYTFKGWTYEGQSTPKKDVTLQAVEGVFEGDIELRANWEAKGYTITYDLKGGTLPIGKSNPTNYTVDSGDIELVNPERSGSVFEGWIASGMTLPVGVVIVPRGSVGNRSYTASYTCMEGYTQNNNECIKETYNVTYQDQHTYTPLQVTIQVSEDGKYVIPVKNPSYQGYLFNGWKANVSEYKCVDGNNNELSVCKANGNNTVYVVFDRGQNVTLTAEWTHRDVTITLYNRTSSSSSESVTKDYNGSISLIAGDVAGYKVIGWSTGANAPKLYTDGISIDVSEIPNIQCSSVETESCSASLYVLREVKEYKIIYDLNDGDSNDLENPATLTFNQVPFTLKPATRVGYDFDGWRYEGNKVEQITAAMLEDNSATEKIDLRAGWLPSINTQYVVYHVKESLNGTYETGNTALTEIFTGYGITGAPKTPAVRTYVGFDSPQQDSLSIGADGKSYLIYEYTRNKRSYIFNTVVGAITNGTTPTNVNMYYEAPIVLSGKAEIGYSWSGWMIHSGTTDIFVPVEDTLTSNHLYEFTMPLNDVIVEPVVYHIPYTLTYNVNGGTGNETELQEVSPIYYDSGITYPVVTRTGYSFQGWYDDNGTEDESDDVYYGLGDDINNKNMPNKNLNLVAHWSANPFVLKVNHYQMDLTGNYPAQPTKEVPIDTTIDADITSGNNANILPETYTGFTLSGDAVESIHINPDGTTKIDYYYIRDKHNVTVNTNEGVTLSGTLSGSYYYQTPVSVEAIINEGYTWSGWNVTTGENEPVFTTDTGVSFILGTGNVILTPLTITNSYHLTIKNDGIFVFSGDVLYKTNISQYLTTPSKAGYTFNGWANRPANDLMPAKDLIIEAKWTYKGNGGGGGGGGGGPSSSDDKKVIINNTGDKQQEHSSAELTGTNLTGTNKDLKENEVKEEQPEKTITDMNFDELKNLSADKLKKVDRTKLTKEENEILDAYEWAYEHNVTTMVTLNDANPEGIVTRGHLAKMVVNYAINVLGQQLPEKVPSECRWNDWRGDWESDEIKDYAVKACSLGLMGLDMKKFSPKLRVTRAQFGTIMSRLLWGKKYAGGTPYYRKHLNALKENNIMTQIGNPEGRVELRQWVWLMLMRAAMGKNV